MRVLGIETSCDETGIAIYDSEHGLLAHCLHSQSALHANYGGVVPELASRDHIRKTLPLIQQTLHEAKLAQHQIDAIAYTAGPGLVGALMVGASVASSLAFAWEVPALAIHHLEAHLLAPMLEPNPPEYPFIALLVSGGHTQLISVQSFGEYELLGESIDDAAGEAFDKVARVLGLAQPGGPALAELAKQGTPGRFVLARPMTQRPGLDFSFSGLKTQTITTLQKAGDDSQTRADIAYAFQDAAIDTLVIKCKRAIKQTGLRRLVIAGGVSANELLRQRLHDLGKQLHCEMYFPRHEFCTDNGAMVAYAGYARMREAQDVDLIINVKPRWPLAVPINGTGSCI